MLNAGEKCISNENEDQQSELEAAESPPTIASLITGKVLEAFLNIPVQLKELNEAELYEAVGPTAADWALRRRFTAKVREARESHIKEITASAIYGDVTSRSYFFTYLMTNPLKVAFITRPLLDHSKMYESIHEEAMAKIYAILQKFPIDPKYLPQITKVAEMSANRAHGAIVQRQQIVQKNINGGSDGPRQIEGQGTIQDQIDALQKQLLTQQRDVTPREV